MASDLRYGVGGLRFPPLDNLVLQSDRRVTFEDSWTAKCEASVSNWEPKMQSASIWSHRDPPSSPIMQPYREELSQDSWRSTYQQSEVHDGWFPEPRDSDPAQRPAKPPVPEGFPPGNATLTYSTDSGGLVSIPGLNLAIIEERSLLLATAFEGSQSGQRLYLETLSGLTVMPLLRYLYTGSYAEHDFWDEVPTSLLLHCKMYQLGMIYDIDELEKQAKYNITRQCAFGCSSPDQPIDLCSAIRFAYNELQGHEGAVSEIIHYCVSRFLNHNLGEDTEFKAMAFDLRPFHQDLVKVCKERGYADESAAAIIQMPYKPYQPETYASTETPAIARFEDLVFHFHGSDEFEDVSPTKRARLANDHPTVDKGKQKVIDSPRSRSALTLALRQAALDTQKPSTHSTASTKEKFALPIRARPASKAFFASTRFTEEASASEDEDLLIVRKRKQPHTQARHEKSAIAVSDSDFELISGPEAVLSASSEDNDDSDTATLVEAPVSTIPTNAATTFTPLEPLLLPPTTERGDTDDWFSGGEWEDFI